MKKNILRTSIISLMMFIISAIPVMAQTKKYSYDLVVGGSETKYVATKAGGSSFENKYYVHKICCSANWFDKIFFLSFSL